MNRNYEPQTGRGTRKGGAGRFFLIIIVLLVALFVTNPNKDEFVEYALKNVNEDGGSKLTEGIANAIGKPLLNSVTEREDYFFFSIYKLPDLEQSNKYLGIFKKVFIKL
jgi:hypothetical protein